MKETPSEEGEDSTSLRIPDEQLNKYIGDTVNDFPEFFPPSQSQPSLGSDSEGVIENLLENGDQIMKDLIFKKISDCFLKPRDFPGSKKLDIKLPQLMSSKSAYSSVLDKLFIQKNSALCFSLTYEEAGSVGAQYSLLASVIFTDPIYANIPVKVCLNHRDRSSGPSSRVGSIMMIFPVLKGLLRTTSSRLSALPCRRCTSQLRETSTCSKLKTCQASLPQTIVRLVNFSPRDLFSIKPLTTRFIPLRHVTGDPVEVGVHRLQLMYWRSE